MLRRIRLCRLSALLCTALTLCAALAGEPEPPDTEWRKLETRLVPLNPANPVKSPGMYDPALFHMLVFAPNGAAVDIGLPHFGNDASGKPRPPLMAKYAQDFIWIDLDFDGKPSAGEARRIGPDGWSDTYACDLFYEDGSSGKYAFRLKTIVEKEKYAMVRAVARIFEYKGKQVRLLDDDGNGKYGDAARDSISIDGQPVCLLGGRVMIGDTLVELIVHASGETVEVRAAPKELPLGAIDAFEKYAPSQTSEDYKVDTLIVCGPEGAFAFDAKHRLAKVPAGVYDIAFGLIERRSEAVFVKKGEKTSFTVTANIVSSLKWGAKITPKFAITSDGEDVTVSGPRFLGQMTEEYFPELGKALTCTARMALVYKDGRFNVENFQIFGQKRLDQLPEGGFKPAVIKRYRNKADEYDGSVEYISGVLGRVDGKERFSFVYKKKELEKK